MRPVQLVYIAIVLLVSAAHVQAVTLTFDEIPPGESPNYYRPIYGTYFAGFFYVADHSQSSWGRARSGSNVLAYQGYPSDMGAMLKFVYPNNEYFRIYSLGAYFSTQDNTVVRLTGYNAVVEHPVSSILVGQSGQSWENVYVELFSPEGAIDFVMFEPVSSLDALNHFCADDMTFTLVPEPSSLLALGGGLGALGLLRRRK